MESIQEHFANFSKFKEKENLGNNTCVICLAREESTNDVLWSCPTAQDVWNHACVKIQKIFLQLAHFIDIWQLLLDKLKPFEISEAAILMRLIWHMRNDFLHGKLFTHPNLLLQKASSNLSDFIQTQDSHSHHSPPCSTATNSAKT